MALIRCCQLLNSTRLKINVLLRGQTYDGASVLQGQHKGVARQILTVNPKAYATHCLSHNLNLILQECASTNTLISGVFSVVQSISAVVRASPKR